MQSESNYCTTMMIIMRRDFNRGQIRDGNLGRKLFKCICCVHYVYLRRYRSYGWPIKYSAKHQSIAVVQLFFSRCRFCLMDSSFICLTKRVCACAFVYICMLTFWLSIARPNSCMFATFIPIWLCAQLFEWFVWLFICSLSLSGTLWPAKSCCCRCSFVLSHYQHRWSFDDKAPSIQYIHL